MNQIDKPVMGARAISVKLRRSIETGYYVNGDQLPTERLLAESFSASRSTIRSALNQLEEAGLVARKVGSGTFVTYSGAQEPDVIDVIDQISPIQLIDARIGVERQMTRLAVFHATRRDLEVMEEILNKMVQSESDRDEFSRLDTRFHMMLAKATGNPLMVHLYEQINDVRSHAQWKTMKDVILTRQQIVKYNEFHTQILKGIKNRDANYALEALNGHMELARSDLMGAIDKL